MFGNDALHRVGLVRLAQVRVPLHQVERGPTAELLDGTEVDAGHDEPAGERVAQHVRRHFLEPCTAAGCLEGGPDRAVGDPSRRAKIVWPTAFRSEERRVGKEW